MKALAQKMQQGIGDHPEVETLMMRLVNQLETVKGKKTYGDVPAKLKEQVKEVLIDMEVPELAAD